MLSATTLKRSAVRRTFPLDVRSSVCRNLFGPIDHDELDRELKSELREICDRDQRRWNFNFESDTPLSGEYDWEEAPVATTPVFYHETVHIGKRSITLPVKVKPCMDVTSKDCTTQDVGGSRAVDSLLSSSESTAPGTSERQLQHELQIFTQKDEGLSKAKRPPRMQFQSKRLHGKQFVKGICTAGSSTVLRVSCCHRGRD
ncbi:hypothetical protein MATL_G00100150 [Megalops atlanticus]|uniref:Cyclin-dependent kinase inhibitor domain-containing protein n=1 Tax=Megalops atlanticus TaxID=7932 RepID=A0A9D3Q1L8_MEGAT|nr:hypothetical protein MATL_G00100150 [Megalops atlanticus]